MSLKFARIVVALGIVAPALSGSALALDGETLINNASAQQGNITVGDTKGYPITLSRSGSFKLTGSLLVPDGKAAFQVTATDVSIDLNHFSITAQPPPENAAASQQIPVTANAINAPGKARLWVRNGTITKFTGAGISNSSGDGAVIEHMRIVSNGGVGILVGSVARLEADQISDNGQAGAQLGSQSIVLNSSFYANTRTSGAANLICGAACLIEGNVIAGAVKGGGVSTSTGSMILGNTIASNKSSGISSGESGFANNTLTGNSAGGVQNSGVVPADPNYCFPKNSFCQ